MKLFYLSTLLFPKTLASSGNGVKFTNIHYAGNINFPDQVFTCPFLMSQAILSKSVSDSISKEKKKESLPSGDNFSIFLVMSDKTFGSHLKNSLSSSFQVTLLEDSKEIKSFSLCQSPDAIIIDENVNGVNGDKICSRLKADKETSDIPVVLIVRKDDNESYSSHEKSGADLLELSTTDICKFKTDIRILINSHRKWHEPTKKPLHNNTITITVPLPEIIQKGDDSEVFINRLNGKLEEKLSTAGYDVEDLASDMYACRSCLYKKVRAITGKSPKYYMTTFKMETAVRLLVATNISLTDLAMTLGICDDKQLIKNFKKYHGVSPTEYKKRHSD